jgi:hypothetical protein
MGKALATRGAAQAARGVVTEPPLMRDWAGAADWVGHVVVVEGVVRQASRIAGGAGYVLTLGALRGDDEIRVWITPHALGRMGPPLALEGRRVRVTGALWQHDGVAPALTIVEPTQLAVLRRDVSGLGTGPALAP